MSSRIGLRVLALCGCLSAFGCSDERRVHGVVMIARLHDREPAGSVDVYALPVPNDIDRELLDLCANDSLMTRDSIKCRWRGVIRSSCSPSPSWTSVAHC